MHLFGAIGDDLPFLGSRRCGAVEEGDTDDDGLAHLAHACRRDPRGAKGVGELGEATLVVAAKQLALGLDAEGGAGVAFRGDGESAVVDEGGGQGVGDDEGDAGTVSNADRGRCFENDDAGASGLGSEHKEKRRQQHAAVIPRIAASAGGGDDAASLRQGPSRHHADQA